MTEAKPITDSDAVVELMARAIAWAQGIDPDERVASSGNKAWKYKTNEAKQVLTALSDAGLAVLPLEPTESMVVEGGRDLNWSMSAHPDTRKEWAQVSWRSMGAAFHPSQLEMKHGN